MPSIIFVCQNFQLPKTVLLNLIRCMPRLVWCFLCWSERRLHVTSTALSLRRESRPIEKHKIYNFCHHRFLFHIVYKQINKNIIPLQFIKCLVFSHHFSSSFGSSVIVFVIVCLCKYINTISTLLSHS